MSSVPCRRRPARGGAGSVRGYAKVDGVQPGSDTETFVALRLEIENWRWAGVPILVRAGKALPVTATEIVVRLQRFPSCGTALTASHRRASTTSSFASGVTRDVIYRSLCQDSRQGGDAGASRSTSRLRRGARRAAETVRAAAHRRPPRRYHALPALGRHRGDVADRAAAARRPAARRAATAPGHGGRGVVAMPRAPRMAAGASRSRHRSTR